MRIAVTGASGGIARRLVEILSQTHEVVGIVRSPRPSARGIRYVASSDTHALARELAEADCVIHAALDKKTSGRNFLPVNRALTDQVMKLSLAGRCRLFIYFSSQVVYSGFRPADPEAGYREDEPLQSFAGADAYTRLKIEDERQVISACTEAGKNWLVVRPTIVMGPGMPWSQDIVKALRIMPVGIADRTMNLIHVDDLARQVEALIASGATDETFNLGSINIRSSDYFAAAARSVGREARQLPAPLMRLVAKAMPSTFWFFGTDVAISTEKIERATGLKSDRAIEDYFVPPRREHRPETLEQLQALQRAPRPFRTMGRGYSALFNAIGDEDRVSMSAYRGSVRLDDEGVTVKSGTSFAELSAFLDSHDLCLATLPEFSGISVGAAFFVDVHGSSRDHYAVHDLIVSVRYLDAQGEVREIRRGEDGWEAMRHSRSRFILLDLTLRTTPAGWMSNQMEWEADDRLAHYVGGGYRDNLSTTLQWYPGHRQLLVYNINAVDGRQARTRLAFIPFRGLPYRVQRGLLAIRQRGRAVQIDRSHAILSPWRSVPIEWFWRYYLRRRGSTWRDLELRLESRDAMAFLDRIRAMVRSGEIALSRGQGIGIRFSRRQSDGAEFVWVEFVSSKPQAVEAFVAAAREVATRGVHFHRGKFVPAE